MSYLMDYGPDWPPAPQPPKRSRRRWPLWKTCLAWTIVYALITAAALIAVSVVHPDRVTRTTVSDSTPPHSATAGASSTPGAAHPGR